MKYVYMLTYETGAFNSMCYSTLEKAQQALLDIIANYPCEEMIPKDYIPNWHNFYDNDWNWKAKDVLDVLSPERYNIITNIKIQKLDFDPKTTDQEVQFFS